MLDQTDIANIKQERKARMWAYNKQIGLSGILSAYQYGCRNLHEMAEHLDVTEAFKGCFGCLSLKIREMHCNR